MLEVRWYYRPAEIPPNLYHLLIEDRYHENRKYDLFVQSNFCIVPFYFSYHLSPVTVNIYLYKSSDKNVPGKISFFSRSIL